MKNDNAKFKIIFLIFIFAVVAFVVIHSRDKKEVRASEFDSFAKCLADKGVVLYGADWCPHCQNQKKEFGDSFQYIRYIECPQNPNVCIAKGIDGYPTWIFADGTRLDGEQSFGTLAQKSGCVIK
ncbi:MAG: hypothetical protein HYW78_00215 [Parcubacteria group bacterium]|nr:hypothetical protein [Parcubacteria group bacterium]